MKVMNSTRIIIYSMAIILIISIVRNNNLSIFPNASYSINYDAVLCKNNNIILSPASHTITKTISITDLILDELTFPDVITATTTQETILLDLSSIRYLSGRIGDNTKLDTIIVEQCSNQAGVNTEDPEQMMDQYCTGPITSIVSCCYCYENIYPSFINEEIIYSKIINNNNNRNTDQYQYQYYHWKYHQSILQLDNNNNNKVRSNDSANLIITNNSYHYENMHPYSYYFCMEPRTQSIRTNWTKDDVGMLNNSKLIVITGKWAYKSRYKGQVKFICSQLQSISIIDHVHCHYKEPQYVINDTRYTQHIQYLYNKSHVTKRGAGYWFHKALLLRHYMDMYNDNDIIIWVDIDTIHIFELVRFYKLLQTMIRRNADIVLEDLPFIEQEWTKEDMMVAFRATKRMRTTRQISASVQLIKNSNHIRSFYDAVIDCNADYHMISDEPSILKNTKYYEENRHDQSILSMFYKSYLSNQTMIGPPVQGTADSARFYTFHLDPNIHVQCPFPKFYTKLNQTKSMRYKPS